MASVTLRELHRYSVNLSVLFTELPLLERPAAAARSGFDAVELRWPFDAPVPGADELQALVTAVEDAGVSLVGLNLFGGDPAIGEKGIASHPDRFVEMQANLAVVVELARRLDVRLVNGLFGNRLAGLSEQDQIEVGIEHLAVAARDLAAVGTTLVVEPMSRAAAPEYPLWTTASACELTQRASERAGCPVKVLYDVFHMQQSEGNLIATVREHVADFGHVQIADVPGRHEPGTGEISYPAVLAALAAAGYEGHVGLEYLPTTLSPESFGWLDQQVEIDEGREIS